jgi:hypothetical protein
MNSGDTYLIPQDDKHLWAVISEPSFDPDNLVVVMFVSWKRHCDQNCILDVGDHPFIQRRTCVEYHRATIKSDANLEQQFRANRLVLKARLSPSALAKIRRAAQDADMRNDCRDVLRQQGIIE